MQTPPSCRPWPPLLHPIPPSSIHPDLPPRGPRPLFSLLLSGGSMTSPKAAPLQGHGAGKGTESSRRQGGVDQLSPLLRPFQLRAPCWANKNLASRTLLWCLRALTAFWSDTAQPSAHPDGPDGTAALILPFFISCLFQRLPVYEAAFRAATPLLVSQTCLYTGLLCRWEAKTAMTSEVI